jgi:hypothetical protein
MKRTYKESTELNPEPRGQYELYKGLGYTIEEALSDLLDNSIDARATKAEIRFVRTDTTLEAIEIIDNGEGIPSDYIETAMQITYASNKDDFSLGKFGLGMKTASFALADRLTVVSRAKEDLHAGRCWDLETVQEKNKWLLYELNSKEIEDEWFDPSYSNVDLSDTGTIVHLDKIDKFSIATTFVGHFLDTLIRRVEFHIGLHFHRFIENKDIEITISTFDIDEGKYVSSTVIDAINPFPPKNKRGDKNYPKIHTYKMKSQTGIRENINVTTYIWAPNSRKAEFQLDEKQKRQGFYWYRNNRIIHAGGWAEMSKLESHLNVARAAIDLPTTLDRDFGLTVGKYKFKFPQNFQNNFYKDTKSPQGSTLTDWRAAAMKISRAKENEKKNLVDFYPKFTFENKSLNKNIKSFFNNTGNGAVPINISWENLDENIIIDFDFLNTQIVFNKKHKKELEKKLSNGAMDFFTVLVFTTLKDNIGKSKLDKNTEKKLEILNMSFKEIIENA